MKVLLVATTLNETDTGCCIERALKKLSYETFIYDYHKIADRFKLKSIARRFNSKMLEDYTIKKTSELLFKKVEETQPDIMLIFKGESLSPNILQKIREKGVKTVLWHPDVRNEPEKWVVELAKNSDYFFTMCNDCVPQYKHLGVNNVFWLSEACDPHIHHTINLTDDEKDFYGSDVAFIGSEYKNRTDWIKKIIGSDINLNVWGTNWKSLKYFSNYKKQWLNISEYTKVCNSSKIILGRDGWSHKDRSMSMRIYMVMACGGFLLTNHTKGLENVFEINKDLVVYENTDDCIEKIHYYLENETERQKIMQQGQKTVYENHTFENRIKSMMDIIYNQ